MIRVLFITHYSDIYGANKSLLALMKDLKERHEVEPILLAPYYGEMTDLAVKNHVKTLVANAPFDWMRGMELKKQRIKDALRTLRHDYYFQHSVVPLVKDLDVDLVYNNSSVTDIGHDIAVKYNKPFIWHLREFGDKDYNLVCVLSEKRRKKKFEKANYLIAISNDIKEHYIKYATGNRLITIYNGVDSFQRLEPNKVKERVHFCVVGRLGKNKNQMEVLLAANHLKTKGFHDFCINFIGDGDEDYVLEMKKYAAEKSLSKNVEFWGYRRNIPDILSQMNVGIMPSVFEAFGRVTVEYMFAEMPVIGKNSGGTKEIVKDGVTGFLYNSKDALSDCMQCFIENEDLIIQMGQKGKELAMEDFSKSENTNRVYEYIQKAVAEGCLSKTGKV